MSHNLASSGFPSIRPSAIAFGAIYSHATAFITSQPVLGAAFQKAKAATTKEEFIKSKEAAGAGAFIGTSFASGASQAYAIASLLKLSATVSYRGAAILGTLVFAATSIPPLVSGFFLEKHTVDVIVAQAVTALLDTVGLALALTWWDNPAVPSL